MRKFMFLQACRWRRACAHHCPRARAAFIVPGWFRSAADHVGASQPTRWLQVNQEYQGHLMTTNRIGTSSSYSFSMRLFLLICIPQTFWILICCSQGEFIVRLNSLFQVPETHVSILCIHPRKVRILSQKHADACLIGKNRCHCNAGLTCMHWWRKWDNEVRGICIEAGAPSIFHLFWRGLA